MDDHCELGVIARSAIAEDELHRLADNGRADYIYRVGNRMVDG